MTQSEFKTIILRPEEGYVLTQVADVDILDRELATTVAVGANDSPDNWREITVAEAEAIRAEQAALRAEQAALEAQPPQNPDTNPDTNPEDNM